MTGAKGADAKNRPNDRRTAFERLTDFARRIVAVPKAEIDQEARSYDRKKKRRNRPETP